jgi:predicted O-methyltransferase YrrM
MNKRAAIQAFKLYGPKGFLGHITARLFGRPHFLVPASSIDFRNSGLMCTRNEFDFIHALLPNVSSELIDESLNFAKSLPELKIPTGMDLKFPERWNSGSGLQHVMAALVWLLNPRLVVETGTANGASALAISAAMHARKNGKLLSLDIADCEASLVPAHLRSYVSFIRVDGTTDNLREVIKTEKSSGGVSIFLHDADHSYLGQKTDYQIARELKFDLVISDDVDTSLAFIDFAGTSGVVFYDVPKFIGGLLENKVLGR